jgi:hypothetical protein
MRERKKQERRSPVDRALKRFAVPANKEALHPLDWGRFYRFVVVAHTFRAGWDISEVRLRLRQFGFSEEQARVLSEAYWHGRCALHVRNHFDYREDHEAWTRQRSTTLT